MNIGKLIKSARKSCGLTQKVLAEKLGVAEITVRQYESNKRKPSLETLHNIAHIFDIPFADFLGADHSISYGEDVDELQEKIFEGASTKEERDELIQIMVEERGRANDILSRDELSRLQRKFLKLTAENLITAIKYIDFLVDQQDENQRD